MTDVTSPATTAPAVAARPTGDASRGRWVLAFGLAGAALAAAAVAIVLLGSRPTPEALRYVPADMPVVAELRMDLPGDQLQKVGNLLAHFPGFKDQSIIGQKIDEALDRIAKAAANGSVDYATQVKPWLAGPLFGGSQATQSIDASGAPRSSRYVVVFTTDGKVTCDPVTTGSTAKETYRGIDIHTATTGSTACALDGRYALVGDLVSVKAALDAHANHSGMDGVAQYRTARDALGGDRLATIYVGREAMTSSLLPGSLPSLLPSGFPTPPSELTAALKALPAWLMAGVSAEDSALVADLITAPIPAPSAPPGSPALTAPPSHVSRIAPLLPSDTAALYELHGAGVTVQNLLSTLRANPALSEQLTQVDASLGLLGGPQGLVGWIDDAGVAVMPDGSSVTGGAILVAADDATAAAKADQIRGFLTLAGLSGGFAVHDTVVNGTKVTTVDLGDVSTLLRQAGATGLAIPPGTHVVISLAARGPALVLGGETFARRILETPAGAGLADQATYKKVLALAMAQNMGQLYVAAGPLLPLAESAIPEAERARFLSDITPYLEPIEAFVQTASLENGGLRVKIVLTVK
jgi:hypothetical protein